MKIPIEIQRFWYRIRWKKVFSNILAVFLGLIVLGIFILGLIAEGSRMIEKEENAAANKLCDASGGILAQDDPDRNRWTCWDTDMKIIKVFPKDFVKKLAERK